MLSSPHRIDLRNTRVLVVDDNAQSLELISQILMGFSVNQIVSCRSPAEGWAEVTSRRYDLIVIDHDMPDEDGVSLTRRIRRDGEHANVTAPVILLSGHTPVEWVNEARDAGANLVVKKPIAPAVLLARIVWLARTSREFVTSASYCGPDRRFRRGPPPADIGERRAPLRAVADTPERTMSQDDVDALFG